MKARLVQWVLPALAFVACLSGCTTTQTKTLYSWGTYESQVYAYLQGKSPEAQLIALERDLEKIKANGMSVPPGFYAHMGLLYAEEGSQSRAIACFITEKAHFPEASAFMDFLLRGQGR